MNEQIQELWVKAGGHYDAGNQHTYPQYTIDNPEKFAELIVEECVTLIEPAQEHRNDPSYPYIGGEEGMLLLEGAALAVKKHFGIK